MKKALRIVFVSLLLFCTKVSLFSQVLDIVPHSPEFTFTQGICYNFLKDTKNKSMGLRTIAVADMSSIYVDAGVNVQAGFIDFTSNLVFWPEFFDLFRVGPGFSYHIMVNPENFLEYDVIFKEGGKLKTGNFELSESIGIMLKRSKFIFPGSTLPVLKNHSFFFESHFLYHLPLNFTIFLNLSSVSYFEYPLFLCPFIDLGFEKQIKDKVWVEAKVYTKWVDMFIVSISPSYVGLDTCLKVKL